MQPPLLNNNLFRRSTSLKLCLPPPLILPSSFFIAHIAFAPPFHPCKLPHLRSDFITASVCFRPRFRTYTCYNSPPSPFSPPSPQSPSPTLHYPNYRHHLPSFPWFKGGGNRGGAKQLLFSPRFLHSLEPIPHDFTNFLFLRTSAFHCYPLNILPSASSSSFCLRIPPLPHLSLRHRFTQGRTFIPHLFFPGLQFHTRRFSPF